MPRRTGSSRRCDMLRQRRPTHATAMPIHTEDLEYLQLRGAAPLLSRFYRPEGAGPFPAVLEVHRRAWTAGDRLNNVGTVCEAQCTGRGSRHILGRTPAAAQRAAPHDPRYAALPLAGADASLAFAVACWPVADPLAPCHAAMNACRMPTINSGPPRRQWPKATRS